MKILINLYVVICLILIIIFIGCIESVEKADDDFNNLDFFLENNDELINDENESINESFMFNETDFGTINVKIVSGERIGCNSFSYSFKTIILDENTNIIEYNWDFGDNSTSKEKNPDHIYKKIGRYNVNLSVFDDIGNYGSTQKEINVLISNCPCS